MYNDYVMYFVAMPVLQSTVCSVDLWVVLLVVLDLHVHDFLKHGDVWLLPVLVFEVRAHFDLFVVAYQHNYQFIFSGHVPSVGLLPVHDIVLTVDHDVGCHLSSIGIAEMC